MASSTREKSVLPCGMCEAERPVRPGEARHKKKLNFSNAATRRGILIGTGANLMNSITVFEASEKQVRVGSDLPYAEVHNEGGYIKIFGKAVKKLPRRQFIGESHELMTERKTLLWRMWTALPTK